MSKGIKTLLILTLLFLQWSNSFAFEKCDSLRECTSRALTLEVPYGKGAHYVDVYPSSGLQSISNEMSVDLWIKPTRQPGKVQFIAGLWGPGRDKNDAWMLYINENDELVFEINGDKTDFDRVDNTIIKTPADTLYDKWHHITAVFDGRLSLAYIYIDTKLTAFGNNPTYPVTNIRTIQKRDLPVQIGSCSAISDNKDLYRTFLGQIDEVRIWSRVLSIDDIYCYRIKSLVGNEPGLVMYLRLNEHENQYDLCDASGNGSTGRARSGARCDVSDRRNIPTVFIQENITTIVDTLKCDTTWTIKFTVIDTSLCGNRVYFNFYDDLRTSYTLNPPYTAANPMVLQQNIPQEVTMTLNSNFLGNIRTRMYLIRTNACDNYILRNFHLTRITELSYSKPLVDFDTVKANCQNSVPTDSIIRICNNSRAIGNPRVMTISSLTNTLPNIFSIIAPSYPITLQPDACIDITIRFNSDINPGLYNDSLIINSNDKCVAKGIIPLRGVAREIIEIKDGNGTNPLDTIDFGTTCINIPSDAVNYMWNNLISEDIFVDSIIMPKHFISRAFKYPILLEPSTGYLPNYFRFLPTAQGVFFDSIIFVVRTNNCISYKKLYVKGRGFFADVKFTVDSLDFGNIKVGQEITLNVSIENKCDENLNVSFYLKSGEAFFFAGGRSVSVPPGQTRSIPIKFMPTDEKTYIDEICLFEQRCYTSSCIKIFGNGYYEKFSFEPKVMRTENVIGCQSKLDTLIIKNISSASVKMNNFTLDNLPALKYTMVYPTNLTGFTKDLNPNDTAQFIFRFTPNDVLQDIANRAYLRYETTPDGLKWLANLYGTSVVPKIFVTAETLYGKVEVGDRKRDTIEIYNFSPIRIRVDSIVVDGDFQLINPQLSAPVYLNPRDSIMAIVDFVPTKENTEIGFITVFSSEPCLVDDAGSLIGTGIVIPLEIPMTVISNGFVRPCDCETRKINLVNQSLAFPRTIDSVWIDTTGIANGRPEFFSWTAYGSPMGTTPFNVAPLSFDTIYVKFCPRTPAERQFVDVAANIKINSSGTGWEGETYTVHMTGKRQLIMEPIPNYAYFPPTRVDTFSNVSQFVDVYIPDLDVNPVRDRIKIDSIKFVPDERVFYVKDTLGIGFPLWIDTTNIMSLQIDFKPRAVRSYQAKMHIYMSEPCPNIDTTVLVYGESFAPSFGLNFNFDNKYVFPDTFRIHYCDTLKVNIYSSRDFPADIVDIRLGLIYDTTKMDYLYADSPYLLDTCLNYPPYITDGNFDIAGKDLLLKNFCKIDSTKPIASVYFIPRAADRDTFSIAIDSLFFDTEEVILYQIIAQTDDATIIVLKPEFQVLNTIDFDSVQVLDCAYDTLYVLNTGDVPIRNDIPIDLPNFVTVFSAEPPMGDFYNVGDTAKIILEFCPRQKIVINNTSFSNSIKPCNLIDDFTVDGEGWAPPFPVKTNIKNQFINIDNATGTIGDTIIIPMYIEKDFSTFLRNQTFWIMGLNFELNFEYNKYSLKYLGTTKGNINGAMSQTYTPGLLNFKFTDVDSLKAGVLAENRFLVVAPDSSTSSIFLSTYNYQTDSLMFLDIIPVDVPAFFVAEGKCLIQSLDFDYKQPFLFTNFPNPWSDKTQIDFYIPEKTVIELSIYSPEGNKISEIVNLTEHNEGLYSYEINNSNFSNGVYIYILKTPNYVLTKRMVVIR